MMAIFGQGRCGRERQTIIVEGKLKTAKLSGFFPQPDFDYIDVGDGAIEPIESIMLSSAPSSVQMLTSAN